MDFNPIHFLRNTLDGLLRFISSTPFSVLLVVGVVIAILGIVFKVATKVAKIALPILIVLFIINRIV